METVENACGACKHVHNVCELFKNHGKEHKHTVIAQTHNLSILGGRAGVEQGSSWGQQGSSRGRAGVEQGSSRSAILVVQAN